VESTLLFIRLMIFERHLAVQQTTSTISLRLAAVRYGRKQIRGTIRM
jgi:hypothetical protein